MTELIVPNDRAGERLDRFLASMLPQFSRARLQNLIREGDVTIDGKITRPRAILRTGEVVRLNEPPPTEIEAKPEDIPLEILFEDDDLLVLNKPAGLVVHPGAGHTSSTLVNALLHHCPNLSGIGGKQRPGIVHRLDKETSGCLVVAKHDRAHQHLSRQFAGREVEKIYLALVAGIPPKTQGTIDQPIARHPVQRKKMAISRERGRAARTDYLLLQRNREASLLQCTIHSGRTHQIRVHLHHLGHPVLGDPTYGRYRNAASRLMLHAWKLGFVHPTSGEKMDFSAAIPDDFRTTQEELFGKPR